VSGLFRLSYDFVREDTSVTPYDNLSYIFGHENNYYERGARGANLKVKNENIHAFRNELGLKVKIPLLKHSHLIVDGAWLYDGFKKNDAYMAAFSGTDVFGKFKQIIPASNFGRFETGLIYQIKRCDLELYYTGLYGRGFSESSGSFKIKYSY
jgi:outer membrane autotransporter protein